MPLAPEGLNAADSAIAASASSLGEPMPSEAREVCDRLGIHAVVAIALRLVEKHFQPEEICYEPLHDPEEDHEWLGIRVIVRCTVDEVLKKENAFNKEWMDLAPPDKLDLVPIVFGFR